MYFTWFWTAGLFGNFDCEPKSYYLVFYDTDICNIACISDGSGRPDFWVILLVNLNHIILCFLIQISTILHVFLMVWAAGLFGNFACEPDS